MAKCNTILECCKQLEAEPLLSNEQLLSFDVRSRNIDWRKHVQPLAERAAPVYLKQQFSIMTNLREPVTDANRRRVFVCHDMMGNYKEDKHYHTSQKFDDYRFMRWSGVDYFCYFSHKYITIPPCGWINAAHKHGVPILGTYIVENFDGRRLLQQVLRSKEYIDQIVEAMTRLCLHFGFEGWLVNVECEVPAVDMENLYYFVERLHSVTERRVARGIVFWYDSVIHTGHLTWQNEINEKNVNFVRASDATLINYSWSENSLLKTGDICRIDGISRERAFFGIDVFGRNQIAKFRTRVTMERIVKHGFSTGIFAPAWTFETLNQYQYNISHPLGSDDVNEAFLARDEKWWSTLWDFVATHPYKSLPFYTDCCLGSGKRQYQYGKVLSDLSFFNLSRQSLQPSVPLRDTCERDFSIGFNGGSCLSVLKVGTPFRLFATDFYLAHGGLVVAYAFQLSPENGEFDCVLRFCADDNKRDCYLFCGDYNGGASIQQGLCYISPLQAEYMELLKGTLESKQIPKSMAFETDSQTDWRVRYYVVAFDVPVIVKDIGVLSRQHGYELLRPPALGALYLNQYDVNVHTFPDESNWVKINVSAGNVLNLP